jgi:predicted DNA-binding transcriptional regulator AlpA
MRTYRYRQLKSAGVPFTYKHLRTLEGRDGFPRHFNIGENSVAWVADEVDAWVALRVRRRHNNNTPTHRTEEIPQLPQPHQDDAADCAGLAEVAHILTKEAARRGVSVAEMVGRMVDHLVDRPAPDAPLNATS